MFDLANYQLGIDYGIVAIDDYLKYQKIEEKYINLYPWMKSIIVFVFPFSNEKVERKRYMAPRFAYGEDYHIVVREKLEEVASTIGLDQYHIMSDTSFLDEKLLAYLGGLDRKSVV